jgi:hypothetical protein
MAAGRGYTLFLTGDEAVLNLGEPIRPDSAAAAKNSVLRMRVIGANPGVQPEGIDVLPGKINHFRGNNPAQWQIGNWTYARVRYPSIYAGIDLVYYGNHGQLEYDFVAAPRADPARITLGFAGTEKIDIGPQGELVLQTANGNLRQHKPVLYQEVNGTRRQVPGGYVLKGEQRVGFQVGSYDPSIPLVIDPVLSFSTYLGGTGIENAYGIALDGDGNVYVTGETASTDFPTTDGAFQGTSGGDRDVFVAKLDSSGGTLLYATYLGGSGWDRGNAIAVDSAGNAYVTGRTNSMNFPTTPGAFQTEYQGDEFDAFVTKLSPNGDQLIYSTYLGGSDNDAAFAIAVDGTGRAYVSGGTNSDNFPTTRSAYQFSRLGTDAFVTVLNADGAQLVYSSLLGGSDSRERGNSIAVDANGFVYITGQTPSVDFPTVNAFQPKFGGGSNNAFVAKFDPNAFGEASLVYSTYLGGNSDDRGLAIKVDEEGNAYVTGETNSGNFPVRNALQQDYRGDGYNAFVTKLDPDGQVLYSTFLGGHGDDRATALALDMNRNVYLTGYTTSTDFPVTADALQSNLSGLSDAFVLRLNATGSALDFSTYFGGSGTENVDDNHTHLGGIGVDAAGSIYIAGTTNSSDFPTVNPWQAQLAGETNAFVAKISGLSKLTPAPLKPGASRR